MGKMRATKSFRQKGKDFERAAGRIFTAWYGNAVKRVPTSGAWDPVRFPGDLYSDEGFPFCVECKKHEGWSERSFFVAGQRRFLDSWWCQCLEALTKSERKLFPLVVFSKNFSPVYCLGLWDVRVLPLRRMELFLKLKEMRRGKFFFIMLLEDFLGRFTIEQIRLYLDTCGETDWGAGRICAKGRVVE